MSWVPEWRVINLDSNLAADENQLRVICDDRKEADISSDTLLLLLTIIPVPVLTSNWLRCVRRLDTRYR